MEVPYLANLPMEIAPDRQTGPRAAGLTLCFVFGGEDLAVMDGWLVVAVKSRAREGRRGEAIDVAWLHLILMIITLSLVSHD